MCAKMGKFSSKISSRADEWISWRMRVCVRSVCELCCCAQRIAGAWAVLWSHLLSLMAIMMVMINAVDVCVCVCVCVLIVSKSMHIPPLRCRWMLMTRFFMPFFDVVVSRLSFCMAFDNFFVLLSIHYIRLFSTDSNVYMSARFCLFFVFLLMYNPIECVCSVFFYHFFLLQLIIQNSLARTQHSPDCCATLRFIDGEGNRDFCI